ncbi:MAG TPA: phenylacetic acid degradation operon negative regulatory protein PaaX [Burkholderiales bacterium]|nr:phenylacetic acid degradation operon negative regulatory protein PaaX [Burkholderiales bacterium]
MPPSDPAARLLAAFRRARPVRAIPLIVTVFGDAVAPHGGRAWLGALIRLLAPLGVSERLVRTSVFRLAREHWLRAETLGRRSDYLLTEFGQRQIDAAARHIYAPARPAWDGRWRMLVALPGKWAAREREHLRRSLAWQGFGQLSGGVFVHPSTPLDEALAALDTEDFPALSAKLFALTGEGRGDRERIVRAAWELAELSRAYGAFVRRYQPLAAATGGVDDPERAFLLRTLLIHDYRRLLLRDPELPDDLLPAHWHGRGARALTVQLYRQLAAPSEAHLRRHLLTADGSHPPLAPEFFDRFGGIARRRALSAAD